MRIKIPDHIKLLYCNKKNILTAISSEKRKSIKLKLKIFIIKSKKQVIITQTPALIISNAEKKVIGSLQKTTSILIKKLISETYHLFYQKLKFVGVGYRALEIETLKKKVLLLKLGYSHFIYFRIPPMHSFFLKKTKIFFQGNSYQSLTQLTSLFRSFKNPEPYKGKGILYENEKITLKEGKKV